MWLVVAVVVAAACSVLTPDARADIFMFRDQSGVLHLTNAPAARRPDLAMKEEPPRPTPQQAVDYFAPWPRHGRGDPHGYDDLIDEIASEYGVEYALVKAVIKAESNFNRMAVSRKGALGLMQLMPSTAAEQRVRDAFDPRDNIEGGVSYLRDLLERFGHNLPLALAAYNAGPGRVEREGGIPRIAETQQYLAKVLRYRAKFIREGHSVYASSR